MKTPEELFLQEFFKLIAYKTKSTAFYGALLYAI